MSRVVNYLQWFDSQPQWLRSLFHEYGDIAIIVRDLGLTPEEAREVLERERLKREQERLSGETT